MNRLVGPDSILWATFPEIALVLWISMPSAVREIDIYRRAIMELAELSPPSLCCSVALCIRPLCSFVSPLPIGAVYVCSGNVSFGVKPSVWLNPADFVFVYGSPLDVYYQIACLRPDIKNWLRPLSKASVLVCDCLVSYRSSLEPTHIQTVEHLLQQTLDTGTRETKLLRSTPLHEEDSQYTVYTHF